MRTNISLLFVSIKLWARAIFLNAIIVGTTLAIMEPGFGVAVFFVLFGGFLLTAPLLIFIIPAVSFARKLPYNYPAKVAWLAFVMILLVLSFYGAIVLLINENLITSTEGQPIIAGSSGAVVFAVLWTRRSLIIFK